MRRSAPEFKSDPERFGEGPLPLVDEALDPPRFGSRLRAMSGHDGDRPEMRRANAIWLVFLYEPVLGVCFAEAFYRLFGVTGGTLFATALVLTGAAGSVGINALGLGRVRAVILAYLFAAGVGGLFLLWAAAAHGGMR